MVTCSRRATLALCCFCMGTGSVFMITPAISLSAMAADLAMASEAEMGLFLSAGHWGLAAVMLFSGWLGERIGLRYLLLLSALLQCSGLWMVAGAQTLTMAIPASLVAGCGRGLTAAPMNAVVCAIYPDERFRVTSLLHASFYLGMIVLALALLGLHELSWDWRATFRLLAVVVLSYGVAALFVSVPGALGGAERRARPPLGRVLRHPAFLLLCAAMFFSGFSEIGPINWGPYFIEQVAGGTKAVGIIALLTLAVTMSVGRIAGIRVVERFGVIRFFLVAAPVSAVSLVLAAFVPSPWLTIVCLNAFALAVSCFYPTLVSYGANRFSDGGATMFAILTMVAIVGAFTAPVCIGLAGAAFGMQTAMALLALMPLACLVSVLAAGRRESGASAVSQK